MVSESANMSDSSQTRQPTFFWQGLLIVLPVIVLSGVGLFSLRQDRILAQHEAIERAQAIADELAENTWADLTGARDDSFPSFKIDRAGQLLFPTPFSPLPKPQAFHLAELTTDQGRLWQLAQQSEQGEDLASAIASFQKFRDSSPPETFAAAACYHLGVLSLRQGNYRVAAAMLNLVLAKYPRAMSEGGLPLGPIARLKLIEGASDTNRPSPSEMREQVSLLCSNAVAQASAVTPLLLKRAAGLASAHRLGSVARDWQAKWDSEELVRNLYASAQPYLRSKPPRLFWIKPPQPHSNYGTTWNWLATSFDEGTNGYWISCQTRGDGRVDEMERALEVKATFPEGRAEHHYREMDLSRRNQSGPLPIPGEAGMVISPHIPRHEVHLPAYFTVSFELARRTIISSNNLQTIVQGSGGKPAGIRWAPYAGPASSPPPILASATKVEDGVEYLRWNVHLASPQMLFARQRERTGLFGLLIGVSAAAALVGFITARRAFYRQQHLVEMKSNFVSSVSHELRAPIASVRLMAEGLERGRVLEPAKQHEYFRFIVQECRRLSSMIENVLDFSRIEQGRKQYEFEPTDLRALVEQTTQLMITQAVERQIGLETVVTGEPDNPEVDGRAIQQALVNLIDNALKHSPNGSLIRVGLEFPARKLNESSSRHEPTHYSPPEDQSRLTPVATVFLFVEDKGEGIPPEEHSRIFERFYRCGSELRRETQGVGIGLSIVKHIVEAHGGKVLVRSAVGEGSRFTIALPIKGAKESSKPCPVS